MSLTANASSSSKTDSEDFAIYFDAGLTLPTPYKTDGRYLAKARDRMDRTYQLIRNLVPGKVMLDVGASPFYLLYRAKSGGAARAHGIYFAHDQHPLTNCDVVYSAHGPIELSHSNAEIDGFPFADGEVDLITACEVLEHFDNFPFSFAKEVVRVLRPGGHLVITVPNVSAIANIVKLAFHKNIYYRYRADNTGRHKHEYTLRQLKDFIHYLGMDVVDAGYMPSPTSAKFALRPAYRAIARIPGIKSYSPVLYVVARQPDVRRLRDLSVAPASLFDDARSIEE